MKYCVIIIIKNLREISNLFYTFVYISLSNISHYE